MGRLAGVAGFAVVMVLLSSAGNARADVVVRVDKSSQRMSVIVNGEHRYTWAVSTGIYGTPSGTFRPQSLARYHRSTLYNNAPMPYSIFYDGNFAIHGTTHVSQLGGPASRGCIRLHPSKRRRPVLAGAATGPGQHQNFDPLGRIRLKWNPREQRTRSAPSLACGGGWGGVSMRAIEAPQRGAKSATRSCTPLMSPSNMAKFSRLTATKTPTPRVGASTT